MISIIGNLKGGVGKSTLAFHFLPWLAKNGFKVKGIDADPQQTLSDILQIIMEEQIQPQIELINEALLLLPKTYGENQEIIIDVGNQDLLNRC